MARTMAARRPGERSRSARPQRAEAVAGGAEGAEGATAALAGGAAALRRPQPEPQAQQPSLLPQVADCGASVAKKALPKAAFCAAGPAAGAGAEPAAGAGAEPAAPGGGAGAATRPRAGALRKRAGGASSLSTAAAPAAEAVQEERPGGLKRKLPSDSFAVFKDLPADGTCSALSITAADEREAKEILTQELLAFNVGGSGAPGLPALPLDGKFRRGADEYAQLWEGVILCEMRAQVASEARGGGRGAQLPAEPLPQDPQERWALRLLVGEWAIPRERGTWLRITAPAPGQLVLTSPEGWEAELGPPGPGCWRSAGAEGRQLQVRLKNWNWLEVYGAPARRRAREEVRPGTVVLLSHATGRCLGVVQQHKDQAALRLAPAANIGSRLEGRSSAQVLGISLTSSTRELCAVRGAKSMPSALLEQLMGAEPREVRDWRHVMPEGKAPTPCLAKLNSSQLKAVELAYNHQEGFSMIWGPPGTGKSATLLSLINALHLWEYEQLHRAIERIVLEPAGQANDNNRWLAAVRCAPRLLVTGSSNAAVEGLIGRVQSEKFLDRQGNSYEPWGIVRVGAERGNPGLVNIDLDRRVQTLLQVPTQEIEERLKQVRASLHALRADVARLRAELHQLQEATPLPLHWEVRLSREQGLLEFHDHARRKATWKRPEPPPAGAPCVQLLQLPQAVERLGALIRCADRWWQLDGEEQRLSLLSQRSVAGGDRKLREHLEASLVGSAHIVFTTLNSAARLRLHLDKQTPFGAIVVDEAAQATEPSVVVPLELARSKRCVLVGDDRQLPPTIFSPLKAENAALIARTLFERLRNLGHKAQLLDEQYRMAPEISAFPRSHFYGGALRDAEGMLESTRRRIHSVFPPFLFVDLQASAGEQTAHGSWRNPPEARLCTRLLAKLLAAAEELGEGAVARDVAVLTPYKAQQDLLSHELQRQKLPLQAGLVQTVDAFQGRECEVIVFSAVRAPPPVAPDVTRFRASVGVGFLGDERRLNVAITRAKSMLLVVGHAPTLSRSPGWSALLQHARATPGAYRKVRDEVAEDWLGSSSPLGNAARAKGGKKGAT